MKEIDFKNKRTQIVGAQGAEKADGIMINHAEAAGEIRMQGMTRSGDRLYAGSAMVSIPQDPQIIKEVIAELEKVLMKSEIRHAR